MISIIYVIATATKLIPGGIDWVLFLFFVSLDWIAILLDKISKK